MYKNTVKCASCVIAKDEKTEISLAAKKALNKFKIIYNSLPHPNFKINVVKLNSWFSVRTVINTVTGLLQKLFITTIFFLSI